MQVDEASSNIKPPANRPRKHIFYFFIIPKPIRSQIHQARFFSGKDRDADQEEKQRKTPNSGETICYALSEQKVILVLENPAEPETNPDQSQEK